MFQSSHGVSDVDQRPRTTGKADNQPRFAHSLESGSCGYIIRRTLLNTPLTPASLSLMKQSPRGR